MTTLDDVLNVAGHRVSAKGDEPLVERDPELARIAHCLRRARQGHGGALVVEGPAGIGKTALLAAGRKAAEGAGFRVLHARGAELEREFPFGVVRQLVERVVVGVSEDERGCLLDGPPRVAARLLGFPGVDGGAPETTPDPSFAVLHGLYWLCVNLAAQQPVALVVDDAHWADGASLRFLAFLLSRLEELPAAVLLGARPAEAGQSEGLLAAVMLDPAADVVKVGPLTTSGVSSLVATGLGVEPEPEFVAACCEATGGTPLLVRALVEALREELVAPVAASSAEVGSVATATFGRWATLRLARLGPDAARLARAVAVWERAEIDQSAALAGLALPDAARAAELLVRSGMLDGAPLAFTHPLLRQAVYREIPAADRTAAHGGAARLLAEGHDSPARVAKHLLATAPTGEPWVVEQLRAAGRQATTSGAPESAAAYLRRALTEPPSPQEHGDTLLELGLAEFSAGQPGWAGHLAAAVESAREDTTRAAAACLFAYALGYHQRLAEAVEVCDHVIAGFSRHDTEDRLVLEAMVVKCGLMDATVAPALADRAAALVARVRHSRIPVPRSVLAMAADVAALANHPADQAAELARRAIAAGRRLLPEPGDPPWFLHVVTALLYTERYSDAQELLDAAMTEAQTTANAMVLPALLATRAWLALRRGDLTAAEADGRALHDTIGLSAPLLFRLQATAVLVNVLVERGDLDEAERVLAPLVTELPGTSQTAAMLCHARGRLLFARHRFGEALADFQAAGEVAVRTGAISPCYLRWRSDAALAALALGDRDTARRLCEEELGLARAFGARRALGVALRAAGVVSGGQLGQDLLCEAIAALAGPDTRLEHARAQTDLGAQLRRSNHRVDARRLLRQALDTTHHLGATALAHRAETELRATGAKPRRVLITGLEALTASERRIAELVAEGLTNREVAQTLFITPRTVEGHLTNVFTKLNVTTRIALPAALATPNQAVRA
jgi:DNA-binding NarL/FixJ family response regulator